VAEAVATGPAHLTARGAPGLGGLGELGGALIPCTAAREPCRGKHLEARCAGGVNAAACNKAKPYTRGRLFATALSLGEQGFGHVGGPAGLTPAEAGRPRR